MKQLKSEAAPEQDSEFSLYRGELSTKYYAAPLQFAVTPSQFFVESLLDVEKMSLPLIENAQAVVLVFDLTNVRRCNLWNLSVLSFLFSENPLTMCANSLARFAMFLLFVSVLALDVIW